MTFDSKRHPASLRALSGLLCLGMLLSSHPAMAQVVLPTSVRDGEDENLVSLSFKDAPLDIVLDHYAELTGRTIIKSPGVPQVLINLKYQRQFSETMSLVAIESILAMNNIALVPLGEELLKVIPIAELRTHGMEINKNRPGQDTPETDKMETRIFELDHLAMSDIQPILDGLKHSYGKIQSLERINGFMITDTAANLKRIADIVDYLDTALQNKVETKIYELYNAEAGDVASRLNELIQDSQERQPPQAAVNRRISAAIRPRGPVIPGTPAAATPSISTEQDLANRGIVQGEVKLVADERTNILIVISRPSNFSFFDKIVDVLDKEIEEEMAVDVVVVPLEYATAEDIAGILNDFVGAATEGQNDLPRGSQSTAEAQGGEAAASRSTALQEYVRRRLEAAQSRTTRTPASQGTSEVEEGDLGRLSSETRILADQRTNSLLLMGRNSDIVVLKGVIDDLDIMLSQVLIEAVILEVNLSDNLQHGINWLQRSFTVSNEETVGPGGGLTVRQPVIGFGGGQRLQDGLPFLDGSQIDREVGEANVAAGGLSYYATFFDLNVDAVLRLAASSSDARILSTPVVVTTDNTEARILVGESRPVVTSTSTTAGGVARNTFQYQEIGISLNVTPRINPMNFVVMDVTQTADNVGGFEVIDGNNVPIITRREMQAQIGVENRGTIALGGLISSDDLNSESKIPILGDLPLIGNLFKFASKNDNRTELLVLITPYVMSSPAEIFTETKRLRDRSFTDGQTWSGTWSDSPLILNEDPNQESDRNWLETGAPKGVFSRFEGNTDREPLKPAESSASKPVLTPAGLDAAVNEPVEELPAEEMSEGRQVQESPEPVVDTAPPVVADEPDPVDDLQPLEEDAPPAVDTLEPELELSKSDVLATPEKASIEEELAPSPEFEDLEPAVVEIEDDLLEQEVEQAVSEMDEIDEALDELPDDFLEELLSPLEGELEEGLDDVPGNHSEDIGAKADEPEPIGADELEALMDVDFYSDRKGTHEESVEPDHGFLVMPLSLPVDESADDVELLPVASGLDQDVL